MTVTDRTDATAEEFDATLARFEGASAAPESFDPIAALRRVEATAERQYREAWTAWEATLPAVAGAPASTESRIAWARVNQALSDQEALADALAEDDR